MSRSRERAGGGRAVEVEPERLAGFLERFAAGHGGALSTTLAPRQVEVTAGDGARAAKRIVAGEYMLANHPGGDPVLQHLNRCSGLEGGHQRPGDKIEARTLACAIAATGGRGHVDGTLTEDAPQAATLTREPRSRRCAPRRRREHQHGSGIGHDDHPPSIRSEPYALPELRIPAPETAPILKSVLVITPSVRSVQPSGRAPCRSRPTAQCATSAVDVAHCAGSSGAGYGAGVRAGLGPFQ